MPSPSEHRQVVCGSGGPPLPAQRAVHAMTAPGDPAQAARVRPPMWMTRRSLHSRTLPVALTPAKRSPTRGARPWRPSMKGKSNNKTPPTPRRMCFRRASRTSPCPPPVGCDSRRRWLLLRPAVSAREPRSGLNLFSVFGASSPGYGQPSIGAGVLAERQGPTQEIIGPWNAGRSIKLRASRAMASTELSRRSGLGTTARRGARLSACVRQRAQAGRHAANEASVTAEVPVPPTGRRGRSWARSPLHRRTPFPSSRLRTR